MATRCEILTFGGFLCKHQLRLLAVNFKDPIRVWDALLSSKCYSPCTCCDRWQGTHDVLTPWQCS